MQHAFNQFVTVLKLIAVDRDYFHVVHCFNPLALLYLIYSSTCITLIIVYASIRWCVYSVRSSSPVAVATLNKQTNENLRCGNRKRAARSKRPNTPSDGFKHDGVHTSNQPTGVPKQSSDETLYVCLCITQPLLSLAVACSCVLFVQKLLSCCQQYIQHGVLCCPAYAAAVAYRSWSRHYSY